MKTYTDELTPLDSACEVFAGANWYEREVRLGNLESSGEEMSSFFNVIYLCLLLQKWLEQGGDIQMWSLMSVIHQGYLLYWYMI